MDFQNAFMLIYSDAITLILGVTLAMGILLALARAVTIEPARDRTPLPGAGNE